MQLIYYFHFASDDVDSMNALIGSRIKGFLLCAKYVISLLLEEKKINTVSVNLVDL